MDVMIFIVVALAVLSEVDKLFDRRGGKHGNR